MRNRLLSALPLALGVLSACTAAASSAPQKPPIQETITVSDRHIPMTNTPEEELTRLDEGSDAIAVIDIQAVHGEWTTPEGKAARTKVRGIVVDGVKVSNRAPLWTPDGSIAFEFEGGEVRGASVMLEYGEYPLLKTGERYLIWFELSPDDTRWYPSLPFRIDRAGRLIQEDFHERQPLGWKSPLNGVLLSEVVKKLRRK